MPSVTDLHSTSTINESNSTNDPLSQAILLLEKKQRNLGKRKEKLESYEQEEKKGKELNKDQKEALAKYSEVLGQIDCLKEVAEQMKKLQQDTNKNQKRLLKQAAEEKRLLVQQRLREYIQLRFLLEHRPSTLKDDEISLCDDLNNLIIPKDFSSISRSVETMSLIYQQNVKTFNERNCREMKEKIDDLVKTFDKTLSNNLNEYSTPQSTQICSNESSIKQTPLILHAPPTTPASTTTIIEQHQVSFPLQFDSQESNLPLEKILRDSPFFPIEQTSTLDNIHPIVRDVSSNLHEENCREDDNEWKQSKTTQRNSTRHEYRGLTSNNRMGHRSSYSGHSTSNPNENQRSKHYQ